MIYSVQSSNDNYSLLKAHINIPWECQFIKYYVASFNTKANILVSTNDDYVTFIDQEDEECIKVYFKDQYSISISDIIALFKSPKIEIQYDSDKRVFKLTPTSTITIESISHRASLLLGLFNVKLPITIAPAETFVCPDIPILDYGNKFYLISLQGNAVHTNQNYTPSVIADIDTFIKDGLPMLVNLETVRKPIKIKINTDGLKYLEMQLVDFMFQPIVIKSPVFVTLKIKPLNKLQTYV